MDIAKAENLFHFSENLQPVGIWALRGELNGQLWLLLPEEELVTAAAGNWQCHREEMHLG